jgi:hypothetical protein
VSDIATADGLVFGEKVVPIHDLSLIVYCSEYRQILIKESVGVPFRDGLVVSHKHTVCGRQKSRL